MEWWLNGNWRNSGKKRKRLLKDFTGWKEATVSHFQNNLSLSLVVQIFMYLFYHQLSAYASSHTVSSERFPQRHSLRCMTLPKTVWSRSIVLQFQRWCLNWCWHSRIHSFPPSLIDCIMSGCFWHICRCLFTRPGTLSHITRAPKAPMYLKHAQKNCLYIHTYMHTYYMFLTNQEKYIFFIIIIY